MKHKYPHFMVRFSSSLSASQDSEIQAIPGIRKRKKLYLIPHHALKPFQCILTQRGYKVASAEWEMEVNPSRPWSSWQNHLSSNAEVRPFVMQGFLTAYQKDAISKTGTWSGVHCWHPTGAGKTLTGILWCLLYPGAIVIVTRAASRLQYGREVEKYTHLRPYVLRPLTKKKAVTLEDYIEWCETEEQRPVIVLAWEALAANVDRILDLVRVKSVIFDESHRGKSTKRWQHLPLPVCPEGEDELSFYRKQEREARKRGGFIPKDGDKYEGPDLGRVMIVPQQNLTTAASVLAKAAGRVICTTATPVKDRVRDLWAQLDLAEPLSWGSSTVWLKRYADAKPGLYGGLDTRGESNLTELASRLEHVTHRIDYRETHRQLPKKRRQEMYVSPEDQCRPSAGFAKELKGAYKRGGGTALLEVRLAQAASKKTRAVLSLISDHVGSGHKITVFTGRRRDCERLADRVAKDKLIKKKKAQVWMVHGEVSPEQRKKIVNEYKDSDGPCVLVATGQSMGESIDGLQYGTAAAIFVMLPYSPGDLRQWEGRFCRLGQQCPVVIYYVIAEDTVDEHVADILIRKLSAVEKVGKDSELAEAADVLAGVSDEDAVLDSILSKLD